MASVVRQGALYPGITVIWSKWAPPMERSRLAMFSYAGKPAVDVQHQFLYVR